MKKLLIVIVPTLLILVGCVTPTDKVTYSEVPPGSGNIVTNLIGTYVPDPRLETALTAIRAGNAATAPVNPYAGLIDYFLLGIAGVASAIAARKNAQASKTSALLSTVIRGVENAGEKAADVKSSIRTLATATGQEGALGVLVQKITE